MHLSPAALDAAIRLLDEPRLDRVLAAIERPVRWKCSTPLAEVLRRVEAGVPDQERSMNPGTKLAVRQGFEP